ncbi:MAG: hypothetical protein A2V90_01470 [Gammaproteobacteria bacterium RBG_16_57_12]|nr:MAG: hypothetical protein A2V90_01470 [Gammaproteobacteria bacterium RBG_16_57_12]
MTTPELAGVHIVVTRPRHQAAGLCRLIEAAGGIAIAFPMLEIAPPQNPASLRAIIDRLDEFDIAIFISANAVHQGLDLIARHRHLPPHLQLAAVGRATAQALEQRGITVQIAPPQRFDSEGLLEMKALQQVSGKRIVIFRGEGGREHLALTLTRRGAQVEYAECYRRIKPDVDVAPLIKRWQQGEVDIVVTTSNEGIRNLFELIGHSGKELLCNSPLVVVSAAGAALATELGMRIPPIVAAQASDEAILAAIKAWHLGARRRREGAVHGGT